MRGGVRAPVLDQQQVGTEGHERVEAQRAEPGASRRQRPIVHAHAHVPDVGDCHTQLPWPAVLLSRHASAEGEAAADRGDRHRLLRAQLVQQAGQRALLPIVSGEHDAIL
eukprot:984618-Prymnesium_polylepis.1